MKIAIIIVTYNGMPWIDRCLQSCGAYPVVVVDNASTDGTVAHIQANYPQATLLLQTENLGFGQGTNRGIRYALDRGVERVFLLNQDAYLEGHALEQLIDFQKRFPAYGVLSPIHITVHKNKLDLNFSHYLLREKSGQFYSDFVLGQPIQEVYDVPFVNAAAWLVSRQCLETVGGFDPLFFHYGEDDNYCQRVLYHGFKIGVLPQVYVIHDREARPTKPIEKFSAAYYDNLEKRIKLIYADINKEDLTIQQEINKVKKRLLKQFLKLKFSTALETKKHLALLKALFEPIRHSRHTNCKQGRHYL